MVDLPPEFQDVENLVEVVNVDAFANGVLLKIGDGVRTLFFADKVHKILLALCDHLPLVFLLVVGQHPHVHIFALRPLDTLDEVVGGQFFEDLVEQICGEFGAID